MCDASPAYRIVVADDHPRAWARQLEQADIAFGQPGAELLRQSTRVRWVHLSTAGYTAYDNPEVREHLSRRGVALTTSSSVYAEPCAQHVLAMMLAQS
ncbi:MAG TPA: hypothetical protein VGJ84_03400, partial [Polyangiaceae bacterium]